MHHEAGELTVRSVRDGTSVGLRDRTCSRNIYVDDLVMQRYCFWKPRSDDREFDQGMEAPSMGERREPGSSPMGKRERKAEQIGRSRAMQDFRSILVTYHTFRHSVYTHINFGSSHQLPPPFNHHIFDLSQLTTIAHHKAPTPPRPSAAIRCSTSSSSTAATALALPYSPCPVARPDSVEVLSRLYCLIGRLQIRITDP